MIEKKRPDRVETERRILEAYEAGLLQAKIDAVRFNTDLIVSRDGKLPISDHSQQKQNFNMIFIGCTIINENRV